MKANQNHDPKLSAVRSALSLSGHWVLTVSLITSTAMVRAEDSMPAPGSDSSAAHATAGAAVALPNADIIKMYQSIEERLKKEINPKINDLTFNRKFGDDDSQLNKLKDEQKRLRQQLRELQPLLPATPIEITAQGPDGKETTTHGTLGVEAGDTAKDPELEDLLKQSQAEPQNQSPHGHGHPVFNGVKSFSTQFVTYSVATGIIAASNLVYADPGDPNWLENWEKQTTSVMGVAGFAVFLAGNHGTTSLLNKLKIGAIAPGLTNFLGMGFGMLAQSLFSELSTDANIRQCFNFRSKDTKPDPEACAKARTDWLDSGKIMAYAPQTVGMFGSTVIANQAQKILAKSKFGKGYIKLTERGIDIVPKSYWLANTAKFVGRIPLKLSGLVNFVAFLAVDTDIVEPYVNYYWQDLKENYFDPTAYLNSKVDLHSEFFWPKSYQPIDNAFAVEATTPYTAHGLLMDFYRQMQTNGWKAPAPLSSCVPSATAAAEKANPDALKQTQAQFVLMRWATEISRKKSEAQLRCEVFAQPEKLLESYDKTNHDWRDNLLGQFTSSYANWSSMISEFSAAYAASYQLGDYLTKAKNKQVFKNAAPPNLSREALAKAIAGPDGESPEGLNSWFLDGTWIPTPGLIDYVTAGSACGSEPTLDPNATQPDPLRRVLGGVYTFLARQMASPSYVSTPYGSSLRFVPPKLTNKNRQVCQNVHQDTYSTVNYMIGGWLPKSGEDKSATVNPFTGTFSDGSGTNYPSLAAYTYANLDPAIYQQDGYIVSFGPWWNDHFDKVITPVWRRYDETFKTFLREKYFPVLFDRTFRYGCKVKSTELATNKPVDEIGLSAATMSENGAESQCQGESNAYRVGNGVMLAIETELRNYLRGIYSLDIASLPPSTNAAAVKKAKTDVLQLSNDLLANTRVVSASDLVPATFDQHIKAAQDDLKKIGDLVSVRLQAVKSADNTFRSAILKKFAEQIQRLIEEEQGYAKNIHLLEHGVVDAPATDASMTSHMKPAVDEPTNDGTVDSLNSDDQMGTN